VFVPRLISTSTVLVIGTKGLDATVRLKERPRDE